MAKWSRRGPPRICSRIRRATTPVPCSPPHSNSRLPAKGLSGNRLERSPHGGSSFGANMLWSGTSLHRNAPNLIGIFGDGSIGGEPGHSRDIEDASPRPGRSHAPARIDAALRLVVGIEIHTHHVVVEMAKRVCDRFEAADIAGAKFTAADCVDRACQHRRAPYHVGGVQAL